MKSLPVLPCEVEDPSLHHSLRMGVRRPGARFRQGGDADARKRMGSGFKWPGIGARKGCPPRDMLGTVVKRWRRIDDGTFGSRFFFRRWSSFFFLFALFSLFPWSSMARDTRNLRKRIVTIQDQLKRLGEEARIHDMEAQSAEKMIDDLALAIESLDIEIETASKGLELAELEMTENNDAMLEALDEERQLRENIGKHNRFLQMRLRAVYKQGRFTALKLVLGSASAGEFLRSLHYLSLLTRSDREQIAILRSQRKLLSDVRARRKEVGERLREIRTQAAQRREILETRRREKRDLLGQFGAHQKKIEKRRDRLLQTNVRLRFYLAELEETLGRAEDLEEYRGELEWPVEGKVISGFGKKRHQLYDTVIIRNGIQIAAQQGQPIRAVFQGKVRFSGRFHGYGKLVILEHPGAYYTLYGHLGTLRFQRGAEIQEGMVLGTVGETGVTTRNSLYFEVRKGLTPQNPLKWLKRRRNKSRRRR